SVRRFRLLQPIHFGLFLWLFGRKSAAPSPRSLAIGDDNAASFSFRIVVVDSFATVSPRSLAIGDDNAASFSFRIVVVDSFATVSPRSLAIGDDNAASFSSRIVVVGSLATVTPQRLHTNGIELAPGVWHIPP